MKVYSHEQENTAVFMFKTILFHPEKGIIL